MQTTDSPWPEKLISANGVSLLIRDSGGPGAPVVFLHGLGGYSMEWWPVAARLNSEHRVIAFDQRGHGASTRRPDDVGREAFVSDVVAVLDALGIAQSVTLIGQSMGAHTALMTAAAHPERVHDLVLVEGGVGGDGRQATDDVIEWFDSWPTPFADLQAATDFFGGEQSGRVWAEGLLSTSSGLVGQWELEVLREAIDAVHSVARWKEWASIRCPVLLVKGARGFIAGDELEQMLATNARANLIEIDGAGHDVHLDADVALAAAIARFMAD